MSGWVGGGQINAVVRRAGGAINVSLILQILVLYFFLRDIFVDVKDFFCVCVRTINSKM